MGMTQDRELEWEFEDEQSLGGRLQQAQGPALYEASPQPAFRFVCVGGCQFGKEVQCRRILRTAIRDAIGLASGAAVALEGLPSAQTVRLFSRTFGHPPGRAVPWARGASSGAIVARRYRLSIHALQRRATVYSCDATLAGFNAITDSPSQVRLGPSFWTQNRRMDRAATILHEMMHQYFLEFILHNVREHRRNNANCLANFALRVRGLTPPQVYLDACRQRPV